MTNNFTPNYIKCPGCKNILDLSFIDKKCPNPLCLFNFKGLEPLLYKNDSELHKELIQAYRGDNDHIVKLLATAVRFNIGNYLSHFISCTWGAHYQTLFKNFILLYLDDLNILKQILKSEVIKEDKENTVISKKGYKMFWDLYKYLMKVHSPDIQNFLRLEFPVLYRKYYKKTYEKHKKERIPNINKNQRSLI
jgi:hypothetical protein